MKLGLQDVENACEWAVYNDVDQGSNLATMVAVDQDSSDIVWSAVCMVDNRGTAEAVYWITWEALGHL